MLTRIEIDGFKTFENFALDLKPFAAIVGPNASGKSNLFDAIRFLSLLARHDVRTAMQQLRGEPEELFRRTEASRASRMRFAVQILLDAEGTDSFGSQFEIKAQRLHYEVEITIKHGSKGQPRGIFVTGEECRAIPRKEEKVTFPSIKYLAPTSRPFLLTKKEKGQTLAFEIRQDGATKRGRPVTLPAAEASRTALSTISTAEFPHLYALKDLFVSTQFLEINPQAARRSSDRFESRDLRPDASNLSAVLARLKEITAADDRPEGIIADISADLASLVPSVRSVKVFDDEDTKEYSFGVAMSEQLQFSSRVISDGTLRLLALLAVLDDPNRKGILCFEEPENGVHEGRIPMLVEFLRKAVSRPEAIGTDRLFQVLVNTHSPAVMAALQDEEIVAADSVSHIDPKSRTKAVKTRMRTGVKTELDLNPETDLTRGEVAALLKRQSGEA
ncbi:MAG: AAA family ATPase [Magnetospirillum sp. WYHS-4]